MHTVKFLKLRKKNSVLQAVSIPRIFENFHDLTQPSTIWIVGHLNEVTSGLAFLVTKCSILSPNQRRNQPTKRALESAKSVLLTASRFVGMISDVSMYTNKQRLSSPIRMLSFITTLPFSRSPAASDSLIALTKSSVFVTGEQSLRFHSSPARPVTFHFHHYSHPRRASSPYIHRPVPGHVDEHNTKNNRQIRHATFIPMTMRRKRKDFGYDFESSSFRQRKRFDEGVTRFSDVVRTARSAWQDASASNRLVAMTLLVAGLSVTAAAVNVVLHISFALAFAVVPLLLMPLLFTLIAGLGVFAFMATATAGAGFMFLGTPFFVISVAVKALAPVLLAAVAINWAVSKGMKLFGISSSSSRKNVYFTDDPTHDNVAQQRKQQQQEMEDKRDETNDQLRDFDRLLRNRTATSQSMKWDDNVNDWNLGDVIDELDACGLGKYRQLFIDERIDGNTLLSLSDADIREEFGDSMPLGDRRRLSRLVSSLRSRASKRF